jgi:hypothetical protein
LASGSGTSAHCSSFSFFAAFSVTAVTVTFFGVFVSPRAAFSACCTKADDGAAFVGLSAVSFLRSGDYRRTGW